MQRKNPYARIVLYPCKFCQGWHIGNAFNRHEAKRSFNRLTKMMSHPNFLIKVPEEIRGHLLYKREQMEGFLAQKKRELYS